MLNSQSLAEFSTNIANTESDTELEQRLGLYRVFLKMYEHHRGLLDEILDLENTNRKLSGRPVQYLQAVVRKQEVYLITNLLQGSTLSVLQPQNVWVIGRDRKAALQIEDKRLSRRHAAIQYVENQGFYLVDLNSTNGTFVNGEPVRYSVRLQDGDQVRLGSLVFSFFLCWTAQMAEPSPTELLEQIDATRQDAMCAAAISDSEDSDLSLMMVQPDSSLSMSLSETSSFLLDRSEYSL